METIKNADYEEEMFAKARAWMNVLFSRDGSPAVWRQPFPSGQKQGDAWGAEPPEELRDYVTSLIWQDEKDWENYIENGGEMIEYYRLRRLEKKALASTPEALAAKAAQKAEKEAARAAARMWREAQREALKAAAVAQKEAARLAQKAAADSAVLAGRIAAGERCSPRLRSKAGF